MQSKFEFSETETAELQKLGFLHSLDDTCRERTFAEYCQAFNFLELLQD